MYPWREDDARVLRYSVDAPRPERDGSFECGGHYPWMLAQDLSNDLFPFGGEVGHEPVFQLMPDDPERRAMVCDGFARVSSDVGYRENMTSVLAGFGNALGHALIARGEATYEVCPVVSAQGYTVGFLAHSVDGVVRLPRAILQLDTRHPDGTTRRIPRVRRLPRKQTVTVRLPRAYQRLPKEIEALRAGGSAVPVFALDNYRADGSVRVRYDFSELKAIEHRAVAAATRTIGWTARGAFQEACTGYYLMERYLRFASFKAALRGLCVTAINQILDRSCAQAAVRLRGLPTREDVRERLRRLREGELDFASAIRELSVYR